MFFFDNENYNGAVILFRNDSRFTVFISGVDGTFECNFTGSVVSSTLILFRVDADALFIITTTMCTESSVCF